MTERAAVLAADTIAWWRSRPRAVTRRRSSTRSARGLAGAPGLHLADDHDAVLAALPTRRPAVPLVLLAGHVDTVPVAGAGPAALDGGVVRGRGAADMKGGLAVMLALADEGAGERLGRPRLPVLRARGGADHGVRAAAGVRPRAGAREAALAIVLEPTANALEVGCNGNLQAVVRVRGRAAHSARPWLGDNAIHAAIEALGPVADLPVRDVDVDGLVFREVVSVTTIAGGVAGNVVPDLVEAHVNMRYAPTHTPDAAEARLRELLGHPRVELEILGNAPPGRVCLDNPLVTRLRASGDLEVRPKQAWTPVAEFGMVGVDAVNLGPGDPRYAHTDDEQVTATALARTHQIVSAFLAEEA